MQWVYLNHDFVPIKQASISINDHGFLYGYSVYESIPIIAAKPFLLAEHVIRLNQGLQNICIPYQIEVKWLAEIIKKLCIQNDVQDLAKCYIQITGGECSERHYRPHDNPPTVLVRLYPWVPEKMSHHAITVQDARYQHCQTKSNSLLAHALAGRKAYSASAIESIFIRDGYIQECTSSNIFLVKSNTLYTPCASQQLIAGVTRGWVIDQARRMGIFVQESVDLSPDDLYKADEVFITASYKGIHSIHGIDQQVIGTGSIGSLTQQLMHHYVAAYSQDIKHF